eukprot:138457_1
MEENDEALKLSMEKYAKLTIPWKKEQLLVKTKRDLAKKKKKREEEMEKKVQEDIRKAKQEQNQYNKLIQNKQKELMKKLADPNYAPQKEQLTAHAMVLSDVLFEQKATTEQLMLSKQIIFDFLKEDGREALLAFFLRYDVDTYDEYDDDQKTDLDFDNMNTDEVIEHVEETCEKIEVNMEKQKALQKFQEKVLGSLSETNPWLYSALQETLQQIV